MEIKIHGYKLEGVKYEIKLNWNSKPTEMGISGGRIDKAKGNLPAAIKDALNHCPILGHVCNKYCDV